MPNGNLRLAATLLAATLLASCSQDDNRADAAGSGHSLSITSATIGNPVTRVTGDDVPVVLEKGSMGLFRAKSAGYTAALNNLNYTYGATGWQPAAPADTLFLHGDDANVCAYYPHNNDAAYNTVTAVPLQSGKYVGSATVVDPNDICYDSDRALNAYKRSTTFALKHAMAMLELSITKDPNYLGECKLTGITLRNPELIASSTIDITKGTYNTTTPTKAAVTYNPATDANGIMIDPTTPTVSAALLVPFTPMAEGVTIVFSVNGTSVETVIEKTDIDEFQPGHRYTVKVTMTPTELTVTSVALVPWVEVGVGDGIYYPVEEKPAEPVKIGNYTWAGANLRTSDAGVSNFEFEKKPWQAGVYPGEVLANGTADATKTNQCYWNWGCLKTPYETPFLSGEIVEWGSTENGALGDPCAKVAPACTWQVPSKVQFDDLIKYLPTSGTTVSINGEDFNVIGEKGWAESTKQKASGQVFVENEKALFLPAAGHRSSDGTMYGVGTCGYYWSRTPVYSTAHNLDCFSSSVRVDRNDREYGYSVRCVKATEAP